MIFTQEAPLTRKWFSGRSCIRSNWNKLGVNFEERGNRSARRKPSKSGWDWLKLNPHTTFLVEVEGVIDGHYAGLTSQIRQIWRGISTPGDGLDRFSRNAQAANWIEVTKKTFVCQNEFVFYRDVCLDRNLKVKNLNWSVVWTIERRFFPSWKVK